MDLNNWQQKSIVRMIVSDGTAEQEHRLIFGTCNNLDISLFDRRRGRVFADMNEQFGEGWTQNDKAMALMSTLISHAMILAALKKVEVKNGDTWEETELPAAWYDPKRFPHEVKGGMIDTLLEAVTAAGNSPRLFSFLPSGDEEKKVLRLTVKPLIN
jgi:hypothetical protein